MTGRRRKALVTECMEAFGVTAPVLAESIGWSLKRLKAEMQQLDDFMTEYLIFCIKAIEYKRTLG